MKKIFDLCGIGSRKRRKRPFSGQAFLVVRIAFPVCEPALAAHFSGVILFSIPVELAIGDTTSVVRTARLAIRPEQVCL